MLYILVLGLTTIQAQTLNLKNTNGTQTAYALNSIRKMNFATGNLTVTKTDNSSGVFALSGLQYFNFSNITTGLNPSIKENSLVLNIYPNPVNDKFTIDLNGLPQIEGRISILNFEGKQVFNEKVKQAGLLNIEISHLPKGIYLCRYSNGAETKSAKIIKQ